MCSLALRHLTENRYVKCPVHFFRSNIFHSLSFEQNLLTNRIAGKLINLKKIKLLQKYLTLNYALCKNASAYHVSAISEKWTLHIKPYRDILINLLK